MPASVSKLTPRVLCAALFSILAAGFFFLKSPKAGH